MSSSRPDLSISEIAQRLVPEGERLVRDLGIAGRRHGHEWIAAHKREGGFGSSFAVALSGPKSGHFFHNALGIGGDFVALIKHVHGCSIGEAVLWAKRFLGIAPGRPAPAPARASAPPVERGRNAAERIAHAAKIWESRAPLSGTLAERYFERRGLRLPSSAALGFVPRLRHPFAGHEFPAVVCEVTGADGAFAGIWRIYIDPKTADKAPVETPRLGLGEIRGGGVWLTPIGDETPVRLDTGEGVETCLGVLQQFPDLVMIAALSTSGLKGLALPSGIEELVIWADRDPKDMRPSIRWTRPDGVVVEQRNPMYGLRPGELAAEALSTRARGAGLRPAIVYPGLGDGSDFNDVYERKRAHG